MHNSQTRASLSSDIDCCTSTHPGIDRSLSVTEPHHIVNLVTHVAFSLWKCNLPLCRVEAWIARSLLVPRHARRWDSRPFAPQNQQTHITSDE